MDALQREYLRERQELSTKLLQAIRSHEVNTDPVTLSMPGIYPASSMMPNIMTSAAISEQPMPMYTNGGHEINHVVEQPALQPPPAIPPMTTTVVPMTTANPLQYTMQPGGRYHVQVNPDGSQQVIQLPPNVPLTVATTTTTST